MRQPYDDVVPGLARLIEAELDPAYRRRVAQVMQWLPPSAAADSHVVDVGCGRGYYLQYYAELGQARMTGVELDGWTVSQAAQAHAQRANVQVIRADVTQLPLPSAAFSGAILSEILEHVADDEAVLREVYRVVRPGSVVAITVPHTRYPWAWDPINRSLDILGIAPIRQGCLAGIWAQHLRLYSADALQAVVLRAGFEVEEVHTQVKYCLPFAHNLLYGIGKPLFDSGLLPKGVADTLDRYRSAADPRRSPSLLMRALHGVFDLFDRFNPPQAAAGSPGVNLCLKARKPA